jgi:membrane protein YdbS with pleckstrin-like domain
MLTDQEEKFLVFWEKNKEKERSFFKQISFGLPLGLFIGIGILLNYMSGWYTRATMVANGQSTPVILIIAIIIIVFFCSIFYTRHRWEMNDQKYQELKIKKGIQESSPQVQQNPSIDSQ